MDTSGPILARREHKKLSVPQVATESLRKCRKQTSDKYIKIAIGTTHGKLLRLLRTAIYKLKTGTINENQ